MLTKRNAASGNEIGVTALDTVMRRTKRVWDGESADTFQRFAFPTSGPIFSLLNSDENHDDEDDCDTYKKCRELHRSHS